jgi:4-amino-4-deoxy-L-arabinose transferase-like glycosyltransferase
MTRAKAFLILLVLWAAIYLPGLGSTELKGEEGRRILPAVEMLNSGNWLVPYVGGKPFLRKPPLMNWLIALSFKATGLRNEWTARLPSALAVLAMGAAMIALSGAGWMKAETALAAALMAMTSFGLLAKARFAGAEIEGVYAPLFGIAITCWLAGRARGMSPWFVWLVPAIFLGLGALAKGPLHLLFYYGIVVAVLWRKKKLRALLQPAHFASLALIGAIFAAWAIPYFQTEAASRASEVWKNQMVNRVTANQLVWKDYALNLPRGLADLLPWVLFAPLALGRRKAKGEKRKDEDGALHSLLPLASASAALFIILLLIPGILPRYVLPLDIPLALVFAAVIEPTRFAKWPLRIAVALGVLSIGYAVFVVPLIVRRDSLRPLAASIDAAVPPGAMLTLCDPGYQPAIFYLRTPYRYAPTLDDLEPGAACVLARGSARKDLAHKRSELAVTQTFRAKDGTEFLLLQPRAAR